MNKKTIVCYGDSNTYGFDPDTRERYPEDVRWTGILGQLLGNGYKIVEEGCNGRTTVYDDPSDPWKNGRPYLKACLNSHKPVDIVILMLGTNDLKKCYGLSAEEINNGIQILINDINDFAEEKLSGHRPVIILAAPPKVGEGIGRSPSNFDISSVQRSAELSVLYKKTADETENCVFFNTQKKGITASETDCIHLSSESHRLFAQEIYELISALP